MIFVFNRSASSVKFVGELHFPEADANRKKEEKRREKHAEKDEQVDVHARLIDFHVAEGLRRQRR